MKSNIGHLEACAALAALVKTVECLERASIPPQMHFQNPNTKIDFDNVVIPTKIMDWPPTQGNLRRAAVNTFGAGGTNGHAVLDAYPRQSSKTGGPERRMLFKVSAMNESSLERLSLKYAEHIEMHKPSFLDLAYTMLTRRSTLRQSCFITATTLDELVSKLKAGPLKTSVKATKQIERIVFIFTGQGVQCKHAIILDVPREAADTDSICLQGPEWVKF